MYGRSSGYPRPVPDILGTADTPMSLSLAALTFSLLVASSAADVVVSRTINSLAAGSATVNVEGDACTDHDSYGSNHCDVHWGSSYTIDYDVALNKDVEAGSTFTADVTLDGVVPYKFSCALCGEDCTITVPIIKKTYSFTMPPCPISATGLKGNITQALPSTSPVPLKIGFKGNIKANDPQGAVLADVDVSGTVSPSGASAVIIEEREVKLAWLEAE